ncbi:nuclear pore complex protein Nup214-like [Vespa velutina]|uniref:nuclear pore complex protein Nup214-like n=1 Tax=Vespa velutina TaxID=202808 RepID=UPI001FB34145|nr:nuclear pore complex protein Nup214-like [Vespa velutina]
MNTAPDSKDVQEFLFKQANTSQICNSFASIPIACNLITVDRKRGLLYIANNDKLIILLSGSEINVERKIEVNLPFIISKITFNCDYSYLAITPLVPKVFIYDAHAFIKHDIVLLHEIQLSLSNVETFVLDLRWNPSMPRMFCTVTTDHSIGNFEIKDGKEKAVGLKALEKLNGIDALCLAWSLKGKQIVVGCKNGNIVQLKPDLKIARIITGPNPYIGKVISILWISNYQFCAAYLNEEHHINVLIIDAPKGETNAIFTCYEDITYGVFETEGNKDTPRYYFDYVQEWGLIIAASSWSSEVAVLGSTDNGSSWNQWILIDSGRAQLPLIKTTESYPVGLVIDKTPVQKLPWGTDTTLPHPVPMLHILGTSGQLCSFHMVNLTPNCPGITSPPTEIVNLLPSSPNTLPSNVSLSSAITSTPCPKENRNITPERPKTAIANIFGDSLKAAGFFQQPPPTMVNTTEEKVSIPVKIDVKSDIPKKSLSQEVEKVDPKSTVTKEVHTSEPVVEQKVQIDDSIYVRAFTELLTLFEKELQNRLEPQIWEYGSEEERKQLGGRSAIIDQFLTELRETTNSLSTDIAYLKALLLQSFAWVEEAKSKNAVNSEGTTRNCENSKIADTQRLFYYTQSQLSQANKVLDFEWSEHIYQKKSKMKIPSLEFLYQNLVLHNKIIIKEKSRIEQLNKKLKSLNRTNKISGLNHMMNNLKVSSKGTSTVHGNTDVIDARCKTIASKTLSFTYEKQLKLKNLLLESSPKLIKPANPSPIQDRLKATLSSLASLSPVNTDSKHRIEQPVTKYDTVEKQAVEGLKPQCPLALLNNVVAKIGSPDANSISIQNKTQGKQSSNIITFPPPSVNKFSQIDKKSSIQTAYPESFESLSIGKNNATVDLTAQKTYNNIYAKPLSKDTEIKNDNQTLTKNAFLNSESMSFSNNTLTNALPLELSLAKSQSMPRNISSSVTITPVATSTIAKTESINTFSFANSNMLPPIGKNSPSNPPTSASKLFSFVSETISSISLSVTNSPKELLDLTGLFSDIEKNDQSEITSFINNENIPANSTVKLFSLNDTNPAVFTQATTNNNTYENLTSKPNVEKTSEASVIPTSGTVSTTDKTTSIFGPNNTPIQSLNTSTLSTPTLFSGQPTTSNASIFGGSSSTISPASTFAITKTTSSASPIFGPQTTTSSSPITFSGFSSTPSIIPDFSTTTTNQSTTSQFYSSLSKPIFGQSDMTLPTTNATVVTTASTTLPFGSTTTVSSITPDFGKAAQTTVTSSQFPTTTSVTSVTNIFVKATITTASIPFNNSSTTPPFDSISTPSSTTSIFGSNAPSSTNTSIFGGNSSITFGSTSTGSIFDNNATNSLIFGGGGATSGSNSLFSVNPNTASSTAVASSPSGSIFGNAAPAIGNATSGSSSIFGGSTNNIPTTGATSVFGTPVNGTPPMVGGGTPSVLGSQSPFGQASAFGAKPVFESPPGIFEASKSVFSSMGFGGTGFGSTSQGGFGSPPSIGGSPSPLGNTMSTVFGNTTGSNTFESLASQSGGLTFGSLAQKTSEPEKPVFSGGSSFSNWR